MKHLKLILASVLCLTIYVTLGMSNIAQAKEVHVNMNEDIYEMDCMQPYIEILDRLNKEYQTEFAVPTEQIIEDANLDKEEIVNFYTSFNKRKFEKYIISTYQNVLTGKKNKDKEITAGILAVTEKQSIRFSDGNSIGFWATSYYADGMNRYSSILDTCYDYVKASFYKPSNLNYTLQNGSSQVYCRFKCYKYLTENVLYTTTAKTFSGTFYAGGGDLFQGVSM